MSSNEATSQPASSLSGRPVAITRVSPAPYSAASALEAAGAKVEVYVCAEILPAPDTTALNRALRALGAGKFDFLVIPTLDGVLALAEHLSQSKSKLAVFADRPVITFGSAAKQAANDLLGIKAHPASDAATPADLVAALSLTAKSRILVAQSSNARPDWTNLIARTGAHVEAVAAYRAVMPLQEDPLPAMLWSGVIDAILFISDADVRTFAARLKHDGGALAMLDDVVVACLDVPTAGTAKALGLHVDIVPASATSTALVDAVAALFTPR